MTNDGPKRTRRSPQLTLEQVRAIQSSRDSVADTARRFGVAESTVSRLRPLATHEKRHFRKTPPEVREAILAGTGTHTEIARRLGVSTALVGRIRKQAGLKPPGRSSKPKPKPIRLLKPKPEPKAKAPKPPKPKPIPIAKPTRSAAGKDWINLLQPRTNLRLPWAAILAGIRSALGRVVEFDPEGRKIRPIHAYRFIPSYLKQRSALAIVMREYSVRNRPLKK